MLLSKQRELLEILYELAFNFRLLMSTIERETIEVENAREVVAANESKANEIATKTQSLKVIYTQIWLWMTAFRLNVNKNYQKLCPHLKLLSKHWEF